MSWPFLKIFQILLIVGLFYATGKFCHRQTDGFSVHKIIPTHQPTGNDPAELAELQPILSQPFHYLGRGGQCYVFESEDHSVVIKFFKQHHMNFLNWLENLSLPNALENFRHRILLKHTHQSHDYFLNSCRIANEKFKERTGLIYLHIHQTQSLNRKFLIFDKQGIEHEIDLNGIDFALQKKAELSHKHLRKLIRAKDLETAKRRIDAILELIVERCKLGIRDRDPNFRTNIGFLDGKAIEIDLGSYESDDPLALKQEVAFQTRKFKKWLARRNAELARYLTEREEELWQN